jgi:hypothetical protein
LPAPGNEQVERPLQGFVRRHLRVHRFSTDGGIADLRMSAVLARATPTFSLVRRMLKRSVASARSRNWCMKRLLLATRTAW